MNARGRFGGPGFSFCMDRHDVILKVGFAAGFVSSAIACHALGIRSWWEVGLVGFAAGLLPSWPIWYFTRRVIPWLLLVLISGGAIGFGAGRFKQAHPGFEIGCGWSLLGGLTVLIVFWIGAWIAIRFQRNREPRLPSLRL